MRIRIHLENKEDSVSRAVVLERNIRADTQRVREMRGVERASRRKRVCVFLVREGEKIRARERRVRRARIGGRKNQVWFEPFFGNKRRVGVEAVSRKSFSMVSHVFWFRI